jgi:eukaryotic-like serine/threonine-protein kinase
MDFFRFLLTKKFLRHLGLAAALTLILLLGTLLWLKIYTHHGKTIVVPDLTGLTVEEVDDVTSSRHLRFEVIDSVFSMEMPRGTVIKQNPNPASRVKKNRKIFLTMNAVNPEMVSMPQLIGLSFRQARLALQNAGLVQGSITYKPDFAKNNVLQQMHGDSVINEGTEIAKGAVIDLVLGMGLSSQTTRVPDLVGLGLAEATDIISDYYLNLGAVTYDDTFEEAEDSSGAKVWRQYPDYDEFKRLNMGMEMDIWLTLDSTRIPLSDSAYYGDDIERMDE